MADIKPWLKALGFHNNKLTIRNHTIEIDFNKQKINYPNLKEIGRQTTTNFSDEENFVVLECVIRLLKQGYEPSQISLEKGYKLGHNTKSGNSDITVTNNQGVPFLIIEAKTYDKEFKKEWQHMLNDGGQLFSYDKQENKATALVLYESQVCDDTIQFDYHGIILKDNDEYLSSLNNEKGYKGIEGGDDRFNVWKNVYKCEYVTKGILEQDIEPFTYRIPKQTIDDLKTVNHSEVQSKYNEFATILRKYNVSGHENAFDKLVNLFLAKIVDEQQNADDLQFNWKGISRDSYFNLVDRLQKLYTIGMEKFLNETVTYVSEQDINDSFRLRSQDAAKDAILKYFKELKYFSNNDFTFLEVYNERLFYQNAQILVEVVQMLQNMKLRTNHQNQFLGDLFEGYLDNGIKQSEGQFFTPLPIVKFIISSLPLKEINSEIDIPKVLDYACGSGHFLNEYAKEIKQLIDNDNLSNYYSSIYGIEKEYRLSKVSKVSAFMYGQDDINIIYGDALDEHKNIKDQSFSVIISNPPYSVKGFLETLSKEQRNKYQLTKYVNDLSKNNSIELFFLERAKQLLKSQGVAGIIVPISVLSNDNLYREARKMILENFNIIAIAEFGSKTFGATGTNTATLFLQKKQYPPKESDYYNYAVERWFNNNYDLVQSDDKEIDKKMLEQIQQDDKKLIESYCKYLNYDFNIYSELQSGILNNILKIDVFNDYSKKFEKSSVAKKINKKKLTTNYSKENKEIEYQKAKLDFIKKIEQEKVFYFSLANSQKNDVIIVKSPTDSTGMKKFLGYEWSTRKGSEGIKYLGDNISNNDIEISKSQAINGIKTPLFNPLDLNDPSKINSVIRDNFNHKLQDIPNDLQQYVTKMPLTDMLDFSNSYFSAQIKTIKKKKIKINSKYHVNKLGSEDIAIIKKGTSITQSQTTKGNIKVVAGGIDYAYTTNKPNREAKTITVSASGANAGYVNFWNEPIFASDCITIRGTSKVKTLYIYNYLKSKQNEIFELARGAAQPHVYPKDLSEFPIPVPPMDVQNKIIDEVTKLDSKYQDSRMKIEDYQKQINKIFHNLDVLGGVTYKLSSNCFTLLIGKRILNNQLVEDGIPVYSANVFKPFGYINKDKDLIKDFSKPSIIWGIDGDWMVNTIPENTPFYPTDHIGVLRVNDNSKINYRYLAYKLKQAGLIEGFSRSYRASIKQIKNLSIVIPDINQQNEAISEIDCLEEKISLEEQTIKNLQLQRQVILDKYLQ